MRLKLLGSGKKTHCQLAYGMIYWVYKWEREHFHHHYHSRCYNPHITPTPTPTTATKPPTHVVSPTGRPQPRQVTRWPRYTNANPLPHMQLPTHPSTMPSNRHPIRLPCLDLNDQVTTAPPMAPGHPHPCMPPPNRHSHQTYHEAPNMSHLTTNLLHTHSGCCMNAAPSCDSTPPLTP